MVASFTDCSLLFDLDNKYCRWTGYLKVSLQMIALLFSSEICAYLLCKMYFQVKYHKNLPCLSKKKAIVLEFGMVALTVFPSTLLLLMARNKFGLSSTVCWIQLFQSNSCVKILKNTNPVVFGLMVVRGVLYSFNFLGYSVLIGLFCWLACKSEMARKQYFNTARRTLILILLMIFTSGSDLVTLFIFMYMVNKKIASNKVGVDFLSAYYAVVQCVQPMAYLFYLNTVRKFQWDSTRHMAWRWKTKGMNCCTKALRWLSPFSTDTKEGLFQRQPSNLNDTPVLTSSLSWYGTQNT